MLTDVEIRKMHVWKMIDELPSAPVMNRPYYGFADAHKDDLAFHWSYRSVASGSRVRYLVRQSGWKVQKLMSDLFNQVANIVRAQSVSVLERSAKERGTLITICSFCEKFMSEKSGEGQSGISHSVCEACFPKATERVN